MALALNSPTPRRLRRPDHPNLFLLGFSTQTHSKLLFISSTASRARGRAGQGRARQGRGGAGRGGAGQGRGAKQGEGLAVWGCC